MTTYSKRVKDIIRFCENLRVPDGMHAGQKVRLRKWQKKFIHAVYGPRTAEGLRIVRTALLTMARKNAKTALIAMLCLVHLCGPEAIRNGEIYSWAYEREQAAQVFKFMSAMIYMDSHLSARLNVVATNKKIYHPESGSTYKALSRESRSKHGYSSSVIISDEGAQFGQDRELKEVMETSTGAHACPLVIYISTQAADDQAWFSELVDYGKKVNAGEIIDVTFVAFIYEVPMELDPWDETHWPLANPALGDFKNLETMRGDARKAKLFPAAEAAFRNLHLNQRVSGTSSFITPALWRANGLAPDYELFLSEADVYAGLDLSSKNDLTAFILNCTAEDGAVHIVSYFWAPEDGLAERAHRDRVPYDAWARDGYLLTSPSRTVDYDFVADQVAEVHADFNIKGLRFDRWRIDDFANALRKRGVEAWVQDKDKPIDGGICLIPHGQGFKDMNGAVERVEDLLLENKVRHGMHPILTMCASNARVTEDPAGNRKFDKQKSTGRIDGMVAMAMGLNVQVQVPEESGDLSGFYSNPILVEW